VKQRERGAIGEREEGEEREREGATKVRRSSIWRRQQTREQTKLKTRKPRGTHTEEKGRD